MDVPARKEFVELQAIVTALCRYLGVEPLHCGTHTDFVKKVKDAIKYDNVVHSYDCPECGFNFREEAPVKLIKIVE